MYFMVDRQEMLDDEMPLQDKARYNNGLGTLCTSSNPLLGILTLQSYTAKGISLKLPIKPFLGLLLFI